MKFADFLTDRIILQNGQRQADPRVSIIMPTYCRNAEGLLRPCIESVLAQTFKDFEFIIVDDGSTDGSEEVIRGYMEREPRIVYVRHSMNCGLPALRTDEGILLARGPYVGFIFDDNTWKADALEQMVRGIEASGADIVYGNAILAQGGGENRIFGNLPLTVELLQNFNTILNAAVLCRQKFFEHYGLYDPHLLIRRICDWDLWLRALKGGANVQHIDHVLSIEHGLVSKSSLGNTVKWDYKASVAYIQDETRLDERTAALRPGNILTYDVFDPERALPYVRDFKEWDAIEAAVYRPYLDTHCQVRFEHLIRDNRRHDPELYGYSLNAENPIFRDRKRILLVANRYERVVQDWWKALSQDRNHIVMSCNEMGVSSFNPADVDWVILFDCTAEMLVRFSRQCAETGVPVTYMVLHGMDRVFTSPNNPLRGLDLMHNETVRNYLGTEVYLSHPETPWPDRLRSGAKRLMEHVDQVFSLGETNPKWLDIHPRFSPIRFIPNAPPQEGVKPQTLGLSFYLGDIRYLSETSKTALSRWLERTPRGAAWKTYYLPGKLPCKLKSFGDRMQFIPTYDSLPTLAHKLEETLLVVPSEILGRFSDYHRLVLEEDLVRNGGFLQSASAETNPPDEISLEFLQEEARAQREKLALRANGYRQDARWLHIENIVRGVTIRKRVADLRNQPRANEVKVWVFVNSQLFGGSEAYGFLIVKALKEIGFDVQVCIPRLDFYSSGSKKMVEWLKNRHLPPLLQLEYGKAGLAIFSQNVLEKEVKEYSENLRNWLDQHNVGIVVCSGFVAEPLVVPSEERLVFMGLYPPWGYGLSEMTYIRDRLDGLFSDSVWAAEKWAEWIGPPVDCVLSMIEPEYFRVRNAMLAITPVCIAVVGTLVHLKRQKEVLLAVQRLVEEGYDLHLNYYGHELEIFKEYIQEIKAMATQPVLKGRVSFHGYVDDPSEIARDNHLIVSASGEESIPQGMMFNQAAGLVPVACPAGGVEEVVRDDETGFLATDFSVEALTNALRRALKQRADWPRLIAQSRKLLVERCSPQNFTHDILRIMQEGMDIRVAEGRRFFKEPTSDSVRADRLVGARSKKHCPAEIIEIINGSMFPINTPMVIGPDLCESATQYRFIAADDRLAGLHFQVGTFMTVPQGELRLTLISADSGDVLRRIMVDASFLVDNAWVRVTFEPLVNTFDREFVVELTGEFRTGRVAIYEASPVKKSGVHPALKLHRMLSRFLTLPLRRPGDAILPFYLN